MNYLKSVSYKLLVTFFLATTVSYSFSQTIIDLNAYLDSREYFNANINLLHTKNKWQYFSLTDIKSNDMNVDLNSFYSEHNLRYSLVENKLKLTYQGVHRTGEQNDKYRLGILVNASNIVLKDFFKKINSWYFFNIHLSELGYNYSVNVFPQIEHVYKINFLKGKMYLNGFWDHNIIFENNKLSFKSVTEHQVAYNIYKSIYFISELRYNAFLPSAFGIGFGLEFLLK